MLGMEKQPRKKPNRRTFANNIRLPPDLQQFLAEICKKEERPKNYVIARALRLYAQQQGYKWPREDPPMKNLMLICLVALVGCGGTEAKKEEPPRVMTAKEVVDTFASTSKHDLIGRRLDVTGTFFLAVRWNPKKAALGMAEKNGNLHLLAVLGEADMGRLFSLKMGQKVRVVGKCVGFHEPATEEDKRLSAGMLTIRLDDAELR